MEKIASIAIELDNLLKLAASNNLADILPGYYIKNQLDRLVHALKDAVKPLALKMEDDILLRNTKDVVRLAAAMDSIGVIKKYVSMIKS